MTDTQLQNLMHFDLSEAYHCSDCNHIGNSSVACPGCASKALHPVASWLSSPQQDDANELHDYLVDQDQEEDRDRCPECHEYRVHCTCEEGSDA